jgi:hypothetical protein
LCSCVVILNLVQDPERFLYICRVQGFLNSGSNSVCVWISSVWLRLGLPKPVQSDNAVVTQKSDSDRRVVSSEILLVFFL